MKLQRIFKLLLKKSLEETISGFLRINNLDYKASLRKKSLLKKKFYNASKQQKSVNIRFTDPLNKSPWESNMKYVLQHLHKTSLVISLMYQCCFEWFWLLQNLDIILLKIFQRVSYNFMVHWQLYFFLFFYFSQKLGKLLLEAWKVLRKKFSWKLKKKVLLDVGNFFQKLGELLPKARKASPRSLGRFSLKLEKLLLHRSLRSIP